MKTQGLEASSTAHPDVCNTFGTGRDTEPEEPGAVEMEFPQRGVNWVSRDENKIKSRALGKDDACYTVGGRMKSNLAGSIVGNHVAEKCTMNRVMQSRTDEEERTSNRRKDELENEKLAEATSDKEQPEDRPLSVKERMKFYSNREQESKGVSRSYVSITTKYEPVRIAKYESKAVKVAVEEKEDLSTNNKQSQGNADKDERSEDSKAVATNEVYQEDLQEEPGDVCHDEDKAKKEDDRSDISRFIDTDTNVVQNEEDNEELSGKLVLTTDDLRGDLMDDKKDNDEDDDNFVMKTSDVSSPETIEVASIDVRIRKFKEIENAPQDDEATFQEEKRKLKEVVGVCGESRASAAASEDQILSEDKDNLGVREENQALGDQTDDQSPIEDKEDVDLSNENRTFGDQILQEDQKLKIDGNVCHGSEEALVDQMLNEDQKAKEELDQGNRDSANVARDMFATEMEQSVDDIPVPEERESEGWCILR